MTENTEGTQPSSPVFINARKARNKTFSVAGLPLVIHDDVRDFYGLSPEKKF